MGAILYGWSTCAFCARAKGLLEQRGIPVREELLDGRRALLTRIQAQYGRRTVPIVLLDGELVGGLEELERLDREGRLGAREREEPRPPAPLALELLAAPALGVGEARRSVGRFSRGAWALATLAALVLLSRAPFLGPGFGRDGDAWRLADASRELAASGRYALSRPPGYPVPEIVGSLFVRGGPTALNALSALAAVASALLVHALVRSRRPKSALPAALAFAFTPVVYIASTSSMDYLWAQAFALAAVLLASRARPLAAGIALGLAIGSRLPSGILLVPCVLLLVRGSSGLRAAFTYTASALGVGVLCFAPVLERYGLAALAPALGAQPAMARIVEIATVQTYGQLGTIAVDLAALAVLATLLRRGARVSGEIDARDGIPLTQGLVVALALTAAVFLWMPYEPGYLVPFVALLMPLLGLHLPAAASWVLAFALASSSFVELRDGRVAPGPILQDHSARAAEERELEHIIAAADALEPDSVVIAGPWEPKLHYALGGRRDRPAHFEFLLEREQAAGLHRRGRDILYVDGIEEWYARIVGFPLAEIGARPLLDAAAGDASADPGAPGSARSAERSP